MPVNEKAFSALITGASYTFKNSGGGEGPKMPRPRASLPPTVSRLDCRVNRRSSRYRTDRMDQAAQCA